MRGLEQDNCYQTKGRPSEETLAPAVNLQSTNPPLPSCSLPCLSATSGLLQHGNRQVHSHTPPNKQTSVNFVTPTPTPTGMVHPAFRRYHPPPEHSPARHHHSPRIAKETPAQQPFILLAEHQLLCNRELYTLRLYGDAPDDILIGKATELGSYYTTPSVVSECKSTIC